MTNMTKEEFAEMLKAFHSNIKGPALQALNDENVKNIATLVEGMKQKDRDEKDKGLRNLKLIDNTEKFSGVSSEFFDWARKARNYIGNKSPKTKLPPASAPEGVLPHQY